VTDARTPADQGLADAFADLFDLAETDPAGALRIWKESFMPRIQQEGLGMGPAARRFERMARIALDHAEPDVRPEVERSIILAREQLETLTRSNRQQAGAFATGFLKAARLAARRGLAPARGAEMRELRDVFQLEDFIAERSEAEVLDWLIKGMDRVRNEPARAHLAFRPLRLMPGQRLIEQLAAALKAGLEAGARAPGLLRAAMKGYLKRDRGVPAPRAELDLDFWRLLSFMEPKANDIADVRGYLLWLADTDAPPESKEPVVRAVCDLVSWCAPVTGAQSTFFRWLKRGSGLWKSVYERDLVNAEAAEAQLGLISNVLSEETAVRKALAENLDLITEGVSANDENVRELVEVFARRLDVDHGDATLEEAAHRLLVLGAKETVERVLVMPAARSVGDHDNLARKVLA
jgi:hypothetical protein